jgi:hypothetical protein
MKSAFKFEKKEFCNEQNVLSIIRYISSLCVKTATWTREPGMRHLCLNLHDLSAKYVSHSTPNLAVGRCTSAIILNKQCIPPSGDAIS